MAKLIVEEQKEFSVFPPDSILLLKVDELEVKDVQGRNGDWQKLEAKFKVLGIQTVSEGSPEDYEDMIAGPIWGSVPMRLTDNPENKLRLWAEAILGIQLGIGFELDTDLFLNRQCRGITGQYEKRTVNPQTGKNFKAHQIVALLPWESSYGQTQQSAPAQQNPTQQQGFSMVSTPSPQAQQGVSAAVTGGPGAGAGVDLGPGEDPPF